MANPKDASRKLAVTQANNGLGVFSCAKIRKGETVLVIAGRLIHWLELLKKDKRTIDNAYRFGPETYLMPVGLGEYFNHSCEPNSGIMKIQGKLFLTAVRDIHPGEEICFDYSTLIGGDDIWRLRCNCRQSTCRGLIMPASSIPEGQFRKYLSWGIIPKYILDT